MMAALAIDRERLIRDHKHLAEITAARMRFKTPSTVGLESGDFLSAAYYALCRAAERFDPERQVRFSTFAIGMMRGAILEMLREADHVPRSVREKVRTGDIEEPQAPISLDLSIIDCEGLKIEDMLPDDGPSLDDVAIRASQRATLAAAVNRLPKRERFVVEHYYRESMTFREIGHLLQISESRAYQLHAQAVARLRGYLLRDTELFQ